MNPDTGELVALIAVHPTTSDQTLAGMFVVSHNGMTFYDFSGQDFISGTRAQAIAAQGLATTTGTYITEMPLPYSMGAAGAAWLVPIYWTSALRDKDGNLKIGTSDTLTLAGVRLINALDVSKVASVFVDEGYTGAALVREVRNRYEIICCGVPTSSEQVTLTANVTGMSSYTVGGQTHVVVRTDSDKYPYIEATPSTLPSDQWQMLLFIKVGDKFTATIQQVGSAWTITSIKLV